MNSKLSFYKRKRSFLDKKIFQNGKLPKIRLNKLKWLCMMLKLLLILCYLKRQDKSNTWTKSLLSSQLNFLRKQGESQCATMQWQENNLLTWENRCIDTFMK